MGVFNDHPYTSITIKIDQLSKPHQNDEIDNTLELYVSDLLHLIKIQPLTGATEAARAIRKRIKYGDNVEEQLRALNILELLILNSGSKIGPVIARDDKLLDVLKGIIDGSGKTGLGTNYDKEIQIRVKQLAIGWKTELADLDGYKYLALLWKSIPRRKQQSSNHSRSRSRNYDNDFDDDPQDAFSDERNIRSPSPSSPAMNRHHLSSSDGGSGSSKPPRRPKSPKPESSSGTFGGMRRNGKSKKDKSSKNRKKRSKNGIVYANEQYKIPQINYKVEAPKIRTVISDCHTHTTTLNNILISLPPHVSPLDDEKAIKEFEKCKSVRRKVLKYLQFVGAGDPDEKSLTVAAMDEEFLGSLIFSNEQLVEAFQKYDKLAGYTDSNPAPNYDDEESSDESYYTESDEDEEQEQDEPAYIPPPPSLHKKQQQTYDDEIELVSEDVNRIKINGQPVHANPPVKSPPPRPSKPSSLVARKSTHSQPPQLQRSATTESDPFGDGNEFDSKYS